MLGKTNRFHVKKIKKNTITIEEARKDHSLLALFFIKNGKLLFWISLLFSVTVFIIAIYFAISNIGESSIVQYESNGVIVSFDGHDDSILNGTPITEEYASKLFDNFINNDSKSVGVVIKVKEKILDNMTIIYYSDNTALIKYTNGKYLRVSSVNNKYGITDDGIINNNSITKAVAGNKEVNNDLGISIIYFTDGSMEVTKNNTTFFVRNQDVTNTNKIFYTNLSGVAVPLNKENDRLYYSDGSIKESNYLIIDNNKYNSIEEKEVCNNIKIIYYENGYAEVIKNELSIIVRNSEHIIYDNNSLEIINNHYSKVKDVMDTKQITLNNTNTEKAHYIIVLEETNNYNKHNITKILDNNFIKFSVDINGNKVENNILNNNLKQNNAFEGLSLNNNTFLLYEGNIDKLSSISLKLGLWLDYENVTNDYMNSAFIGTVKVYVESLN